MAVLPTARALQKLSNAGIRIQVCGRELPKVRGRLGLMLAVRRISRESGTAINSFQIARNIRTFGTVTGVTSLSVFGITDLDTSSTFALSGFSANGLRSAFVQIYQKGQSSRSMHQFDYLRSFFSRANRAETPLEKSLVVKILLDALGKHHHDTLQHCLNVIAINDAIAEKVGLPERARQNLRIASALHDLGKFAMAVSLLNKLGKLPPNDIARIRLHVDVGVDILRQISWMPESVISDSYFHHYTKRYPMNADPEKAPPTSKILVIGDSHDKMTTSQVYKMSIKTPAQSIADMRTSKLPDSDKLAYDQGYVGVFEQILKEKGLI